MAEGRGCPFQQTITLFEGKVQVIFVLVMLMIIREVAFNKANILRLFILIFVLGCASFSSVDSIAKKAIIIKGLGSSPAGQFLSESQKLLMARRAAIVDAYKKALIHMKKFNEKKWPDDQFRIIHISGKIKGAKILKTEYFDDGFVEVVISIPSNEVK